MRLSLAADVCARASSMGYSLADQRDMVHFIANPASYVRARGYETQVREAPETDPPEEELPEEFLPPEPPPDEGEEPEEEDEEPRPFVVQFSTDGREARLIAENRPWFQFRVMVNGSRDAGKDPKLAGYARRTARAIGMSPTEFKNNPEVAAKRIAAKVEERRIRELKPVPRQRTNDTSMVVAGRPVPFRRTLRWEESYISRPGPQRREMMPLIPLVYQELEMVGFLGPVLHLSKDPAPHVRARSLGPPVAVSSDWSVLMTGDAGKRQVERIMRKSVLVLQVPHHGSRGSLSNPFYRQNLYAYGLVSYGNPNPYDHPHKEVLDLLTSCGIRVLHSTQQVSWSITHEVMDIVL